jgi:hypothetical protein
MANILVSLVSDQTIPNINFIKLAKSFDEYWFITTPYSEGEEKDGSRNPQKSKSNWIIDTCMITDKSIKIEVIEDNLDDISDKINKEVERVGKNNDFALNMTCGTKMMSLGAYLYFKEKTQEIYYTPIGKNYFQKLSSTEQKSAEPLTIQEYLKGYGIKFKNKQCLKNMEYLDFYFGYFNSNGYQYNLINNLRKFYRGKKRVPISDIENFEEVTEGDKGKRIDNFSIFLQEINFALNEEGKINKAEIEFLTGGWFEEYIFHKLKHRHNIGDNYILLGVELEKSDVVNTNDLDVVLIKDNRLIVIECKTGMKIDGKITQLFNETIYKSAALKKKFGLNVTSYLFTMEDLSHEPNDLLKKSEILGVKTIDKNTMMNNDKFNLVIDKI